MATPCGNNSKNKPSRAKRSFKLDVICLFLRGSYGLVYLTLQKNSSRSSETKERGRFQISPCKAHCSQHKLFRLPRYTSLEEVRQNCSRREVELLIVLNAFPRRQDPTDFTNLTNTCKNESNKFLGKKK